MLSCNYFALYLVAGTKVSLAQRQLPTLNQSENNFKMVRLGPVTHKDHQPHTHPLEGTWGPLSRPMSDDTLSEAHSQLGLGCLTKASTAHGSGLAALPRVGPLTSIFPLPTCRLMI